MLPPAAKDNAVPRKASDWVVPAAVIALAEDVEGYVDKKTNVAYKDM